MDIIREEIANSGCSRNAIAQATGTEPVSLLRIVRGGSCKAETAQKLLTYFGYEIRKRGAKWQASSKQKRDTV